MADDITNDFPLVNRSAITVKPTGAFCTSQPSLTGDRGKDDRRCFASPFWRETLMKQTASTHGRGALRGRIFE